MKNGNGKWEMGNLAGGLFLFPFLLFGAADWLMMAERSTEYQKIRGEIK